jgi:glutathione S-transferase
MSPPCAKVHMALHFKGLEYTVYNCKSLKDVKRFNARGRVPALVIDGEVTVDSSDILTELDRRWPETPLMPDSPRDRALCDLIEDWTDDVLYFYGLTLRWCDEEGFAWLKPAAFGAMPPPLIWFVPSLIRRQIQARATGQGTGLKPMSVVKQEFSDKLQMTSDLLGEQQFLLGDQITRADISLAATIDQTQIPGLPQALAVDLGQWPNLKDWLQRLHQRIPSAAYD